MMSFAFRKMQLILLSDDITTVTFYSKYETDFCITLTLEIPQNTITDFFQNRIMPFFFFVIMWAALSTYPDLYFVAFILQLQIWMGK